MKKKGRNHIVWIIAIACLMLIFDYFYKGFISTGDLVKSIIFAMSLEFMMYCIAVYRKDNEDNTPN